MVGCDDAEDCEGKNVIFYTFFIFLPLPNKIQIIMKKFSDWLLRYWWIWPVACTFFTIIGLIPNLFPPKIDKIIDNSFGLVILFFLILQLLSFIFALKKQQKGKALGCVAAGFVWLIIFMGCSVFYFFWDQSQPDSFAVTRPIPEGAEYNIPLGYQEVIDKSFITKDGDTIIPQSDEKLEFGDTVYFYKGWHKYIPPVIDTNDMQSWLQIWNGFQGGIYNYSFYYTELPDGEIYLKCFADYDNTELSKRRLKEASKFSVSNHISFGKIVDRQEFTVYEGDWDDYYLVRVEVWHRDISGREKMLMSKIYRMEGWMR